MKLYHIFLAAALMLAACSPGSTPEQEQEPDKPVTPVGPDKPDQPTPDPEFTFSADPATLTFPSEGGSLRLQLVTAADWKASTREEWIDFSPAAEQRDQEVTVTVLPYTDTEYDRRGSILFEVDGKGKGSVEVTIIQLKATEQPTPPGPDPDPDPDPDENAYVLVTEGRSDWSGEYVIVAHDGAKFYVMGEWSDGSYGTSYAVPAGGMSDKIDFYNKFIDDREVSFPLEVMDPYKVVFKKEGSHYTLCQSGYGYIGLEQNANQLNKKASYDGTPYYQWDIYWNETDKVPVLEQVAFEGRYLNWNHSASRFAAYTNQQDIILFRRSKDDGQITPPVPDPDPEMNVKVSTESTADVTISTVTLTGSFYEATTTVREVGFEWGTASGNLTEVAQATYPGGNEGRFQAQLTGLGEKKTYYYRAYVTLQNGNDIDTFYGAERSFTTRGGDAPSPGAQPGWSELPSMDIVNNSGYLVNATDASLYYAWHISPDVKGPGGKLARNYTVCFSADYHCPVWVAAPRHKMYEGGSGRNDSYRADPDIPAGIQYSSKSTGGGCNKGHMLGSAERTCSKETNRQVFFYSNIAPQLSSGFNTGGGGWNILEEFVDGQVCADTLYEVVGCYFDQYTDGYGKTAYPKTIEFGSRSDVSMPTMFYYVLLRTKSGSSGKSVKDCSASELKCVAFVRAHVNTLKGQEVTARELMSVADLEKLTGVTYFSNVPNAPKDSFKASDWGL